MELSKESRVTADHIAQLHDLLGEEEITSHNLAALEPPLATQTKADSVLIKSPFTVLLKAQHVVVFLISDFLTRYLLIRTD
jgi:hypothetical protein